MPDPMLFLMHLLPVWPQALMLLMLGAVVAGAAGVGCGWLKMNRGIATGYTRKIFHFIFFSSATLLHACWGLPMVNAFAAGVVMIILYGVMRGDGHVIYETMARESDAPNRSFFVLVPLLTTALGGMAANALAGPYALVGYLVTGWGDAVGEPVGRRFGRHAYQVPSLWGHPSCRSLEGSAAVGLAAFLAALLAMHFAFNHSLSAATARAGIIALATVIIEAASPHGSDNFTTMLGAALVACYLHVPF